MANFIKGEIVSEVPAITAPRTAYFVDNREGTFSLYMADDDGIVRQHKTGGSKLLLTDATNDDSFTKQVVAKVDGTLGLINKSGDFNRNNNSCFAIPELVTTIKASPVKYFRSSEDRNILHPEFDILFVYRKRYRDIQVPKNQLENTNFFGINTSYTERQVLVLTKGNNEGDGNVETSMQFVSTNDLQTSPEVFSFRLTFRKSATNLSLGQVAKAPGVHLGKDDYFIFYDDTLTQVSAINTMSESFRAPAVTTPETITRDYNFANTNFMSHNNLTELYEGEVVLFEGRDVEFGSDVREVIIFKLPDWVYGYPIAIRAPY